MHNQRTAQATSLVVFMLCSSLALAKPQSTQWHYQAPMISYLGLQGKGMSLLPPQHRARFVREVRKLIELKRFLSLKSKPGDLKDPAFRNQLVTQIAQKAYRIAKERAQWSSDFQGRTVTMQQLINVQNNSYAYTLVFPYKERKWWEMSLLLKVQHLHIFDCSPANRARGSRFRRSCKGQPDHAFVGHASPLPPIRYRPSPQSIEKMESMQPNDRLNYYLLALRNSWHQPIRQKFPLVSPVSHSNFHDIYLQLGKREGLRLNQGLKLYVIHVKGYTLYRGYVKVRSIGDNRLIFEGDKKRRANPKAPYFSRAQTVFTEGTFRARKGMVLREHPMLGWNIGFHFAMMPLTSDNFANSPPEGIPLWSGTYIGPSLSLSVGQDISHQLGSPEVHTDFQLELMAFGHADPVAKTGAGLSALFGFGLLKKWNWRQLFFNIGARANIGIMSELDYTNAESELAFRVLLLGGEALAGLEFFFNPNFSLRLHLGFRALIPIRFGSPPLSAYWHVGPWARTGLVIYF